MRSRPAPAVALQLDLFGGAPESAAPAEPETSPFIPVVTRSKKLTPKSLNRRCLAVGSQLLEYELQRSQRSTIGFLVNSEGLRVTAPKWSTLEEIERAILGKQRWILSKLQLHRERAAVRLQQKMQWCDGAMFPFLGEETLLHCIRGTRVGITYDEIGRTLTLALPPVAPEQQEEQIKSAVQRWLRQQALQLFAQRLPRYASPLGVRYQSLTLSSATSLWGSCTSTGKIRLNWRLIHFPPSLIDYVVAHELAHLLEMNHSPRFWAHVDSVYPDHVEARRQLRELGPRILQLF